MAINQLIAAGIQQPRFESPLNMMAQLSQMEAAREANALRQMQMQRLQREEQQENELGVLLASGAPLTVENLGRFKKMGLDVLTAKRQADLVQRQVEEKDAAKQEKQRMAVAKAMYSTLGDPSRENFDRTFQFLKEQGLTKDIEPVFAEMMMQTPEQRQQSIISFANAVPGMQAYFQDLDKQRAEIEAKQAEALYKNAQARELGMKMAGTMPRGDQQRLAPNIQTIADVDGKPIMIDTTKFAGDARLGGVGVIGRPADMRTPAPTTALIQDPANPEQQLMVNTREYTGGTTGSPGVIGIAGAQATVARTKTAKDQARADLESSLETLDSLYDELNKRKGLPSTERGAVRNVASYVASTAPGQIVGQAVGTEEQSIRDQIAASRFILVQQIKNATGMSAQQMNSNFELQNALNSLSDPKVGIEAAKKIIENLRSQYVQGGKTTRGMVGSEPQPATKGVAVSLPDGRTMTFPSQKAADDFKRAAGLGE